MNPARRMCRLLLLLACLWPVAPGQAAPLFRAGAAVIDITPTNFPVIANGGFLEKTATRANDPLRARALVLDDGRTRVALCVVDTCMMTRELIDGAKRVVERDTGLPAGRMLVSATHTHSAPSAMSCLGSTLDEGYATFLQLRVAEVITAAAGRLAPARVGWAVVPAWEFTNCRRWIRRPDRLLTDPFGVVSARANMHPGHQNPDALGPSGPIDPDLSLLSVQTRDGRPLALLGNFSMHYFGAPALSADYFGRFAEGIGPLIGAPEGGFIAMMSQGTSGDSQWKDYSRPATGGTIEEYADGILRLVADAYRRIEHRDQADVAMAETTLRLGRRVADEPRLAWARRIVAGMAGRKPASQVEVYAREQLLLAAEPERELKLQALRVGDLGITAIPNEVYAITGLKLKAYSPLRPTFNIELANGSDGYIPPPEQHFLGGYTTWAARTAGLEPQAEPRIVETVLQLLEKVSGRKRVAPRDTHGDYARAVLASRPLAYWRLNEFNPPLALDAGRQRRHAQYEPGVAMFLPGAQSRPALDAISAVPETPSPFSAGQINRAPHFAGGRVRAELPRLGDRYSVELWLWNALNNTARPVTGYAFSRGADGLKSAPGDHLGLGGTAKDVRPGVLFLFNGDERGQVLTGRTPLDQRRWHHVALVRDGDRIAVYLDGRPEIEGEAAFTVPPSTKTVFIGGRADNFANFEGRLDEVAVYDRPLTAAEVRAHFVQSGRRP